MGSEMCIRDRLKHERAKLVPSVDPGEEQLIRRMEAAQADLAAYKAARSSGVTPPPMAAAVGAPPVGACPPTGVQLLPAGTLGGAGSAAASSGAPVAPVASVALAVAAPARNAATEIESDLDESMAERKGGGVAAAKDAIGKKKNPKPPSEYVHAKEAVAVKGDGPTPGVKNTALKDKKPGA